MKVKLILFLLFISSCITPECEEHNYQDDFKDSIIASSQYNSCTVYELLKGDSTIYSVHFFDDSGRTDSVIYLVDTPDQSYTEINVYPNQENVPHTTKQYRTKPSHETSLEETLLFLGYADTVNNKTIEIYYENGQVVNYSVFNENEAGMHINQMYYDRDSSLLYYTSYEYNDANQLIKSRKYDADSTLLGTRDFLYDYSNAIASEEITYIADTLYSKTTREFVDCYNVKTEAEYNDLNELQSEVIYNFNDEGLPESFRVKLHSEFEESYWYYVYE